jgi:hypothetical protein
MAPREQPRVRGTEDGSQSNVRFADLSTHGVIS